MNASALHLPALRVRFRRLLKSPGKHVGRQRKLGSSRADKLTRRDPPPLPQSTLFMSLIGDYGYHPFIKSTCSVGEGRRLTSNFCKICIGTIEMQCEAYFKLAIFSSGFVQD